MRKRSLGCISLALILALGCLSGCGDNTPDQPVDPDKPTTTNYTVTFDVGEDARNGGVKTPGAQIVMSGSTAVEPTIEYEAASTWWRDYELTGWNKGSTAWDFKTGKVTEDMTLTAQWRENESGNIAEEYEENLTWGEVGHLYVHYLKGSDDANERGTVNPSGSTQYDQPIDSEVYGDWGLWVWNYLPANVTSEGRAFYPAKLDESGAVYDIDLNATYTDAGWDSEARTNLGHDLTYKDATWLGIQFYSQDSREHGQGFWVNDGGDIYVELAKARREKGDLHWFVRQGEAQNGTPTYESFVIFDPYEGLEPGSAITKYDVVSDKGNNDVYVQQKVAEGWDEDYVGYQIFVASFADGDGDGMGDLQGIISKLDYLDDLGVDVLWLTPFQQSNSYHGYDIKDYFTVDPRFGTLADYRELLTKAHEKGMKVLMDFVLNHTSTTNPWFEKSTKLVKETVKLADGSYKTIDYRNFYTWQNEDYTPKDELEEKQWFKDANGYYYFSSFGSSMPELNFDYQATRDAILDVALYWMSFGLDGLRLDAVKHIYMENENPNHSNNIAKDVSDGAVVGSTAGDYSYDVKKDQHFFLEFNAKLKSSYPSALLLGENFNGDPIRIAPFYVGLDSQFNFNFYYDTTGALGSAAQAASIAESSKTEGEKIWSETQVQRWMTAQPMSKYEAAQFDFKLYRKDYLDSIFTSNHDVMRARDRVLSKWSFKSSDWIESGVSLTSTPQSADWQLSEKLARLYAGMCFTMPGITWIYNGDELGMFGTKRYNDDGTTGHEDRWLRQPMKWSKTKAEGDSNCSYPIGFNGYVMGWDALNTQLDGVAEQEKADGSMLKLYQKLIELRRTHTTFARGTATNLTTPYDEKGAGDEVMCYEVKDAYHTYHVFINATNKMQTYNANHKPQGTLIFSTDASFVLAETIPAYTLAIYQVK